MLSQFLIGGLMIGITVILHALALDFTIKQLGRFEKSILHKEHRLWKPFFLAVTVLCVFSIHVAEIWIWAMVYLSLGALPDLEASLYFSTTAFTTVGFGDIVLSHDWRLLGSFEAANGFMLFAWSGAFTFEVLSRIYRREAHTISS